MAKTCFMAILLTGASIIITSCGMAPLSPQPVPPAVNNTAAAPNQTQMQVGYAEVILQSRNFNPDLITVGVGTTINWVSKDGEVHTITSDVPNLLNGTVDAGGSFAYTFNQTGDYEYYCSVHGQMGMRGVVHVR